MYLMYWNDLVFYAVLPFFHHDEHGQETDITSGSE